MKMTYPVIGFGTYPLRGEVCYQAVKDALHIGYRVIDTATYYQNFTAIAKAIKDIQRDEIFIISKVWPDAHTRQGILRDIQFTLQSLQIDYLDTYLLHWPLSAMPLEEIVATLQEVQQQGLIRQIGLSNVTVHHLRRVLETGVRVDCIQNEMNPYFYEPALLEMCGKHDIGFQAWGPLARGRVRDHEILQRLAQKYNKTVAQIALCWIYQHGCAALPGSANAEHMRLNFESSGFSLSSEDMREINAFAVKGSRERIVPEWGLGFEDEFDFSYEECWPKRS